MRGERATLLLPAVTPAGRNLALWMSAPAETRLRLEMNGRAISAITFRLDKVVCLVVGPGARRVGMKL